MKLYYCKVKTGSNFGDNLNVWLWHRLFGKPLDEVLDDDTLFIGIGTILSAKIPDNYKRKIVFSSGLGYGLPPKIDDTWDFSCVRGPLTAKKLNLPKNKAITDGAILLHNFISCSNNRTGVGFIPHHQTAVISDWKQVCEELGLKYIDPRWPVPEVLDAINNCELIITEAMHGAIVADTLRIPWHAVKTRKGILEFKWQDWTESMNIENTFTILPHVVNQGKRKYLKHVNKMIAKSIIRKILNKSSPCLSNNQILQDRHHQIMEKFDALRK